MNEIIASVWIISDTAAITVTMRSLQQHFQFIFVAIKTEINRRAFNMLRAITVSQHSVGFKCPVSRNDFKYGMFDTLRLNILLDMIKEIIKPGIYAVRGLCAWPVIAQHIIELIQPFRHIFAVPPIRYGVRFPCSAVYKRQVPLFGWRHGGI